MRLTVIIGSKETYDAAIPAPETGIEGQACYDYYTEQLKAANGDCVDFQSVPKQDPPSKSFFLMGVIETAIMDYLREHESPEQVRIICTDPEVARLYKVVYNFNFAVSKADRMMEDDWH